MHVRLYSLFSREIALKMKVMYTHSLLLLLVFHLQSEIFCLLCLGMGSLAGRGK